ncbi:hypothetical protein J3459_006530 [Metarhizium acridum]|uniref:uncharacterized protein n=1 Tax=Metarhizium acridum TaxID=92637 RepID=UPI001C6A9A02|nr:hypothetical protein J3458_005090 [Metarhizium acridum]KAG8427605.1 hypothetical protein J3459_006530 [Metarhizium acridum]
MCSGPARDDDPGPVPRRQRQQRGGGTKRQDIPLQSMSISGPVTPPGQVPAPERDEHGLRREYAQHEVTDQVLLAALGSVAEFLHYRENMVLVAVGGAVNTILLRSRKTTHDVDSFVVSYPSHISPTSERPDESRLKEVPFL